MAGKTRTFLSIKLFIKALSPLCILLLTLIKHQEIRHFINLSHSFKHKTLFQSVTADLSKCVMLNAPNIQTISTSAMVWGCVSLSLFLFVYCFRRRFNKTHIVISLAYFPSITFRHQISIFFPSILCLPIPFVLILYYIHSLSYLVIHSTFIFLLYYILVLIFYLLLVTFAFVLYLPYWLTLRQARNGTRERSGFLFKICLWKNS